MSKPNKDQPTDKTKSEPDADPEDKIIEVKQMAVDDEPTPVKRAEP